MKILIKRKRKPTLWYEIGQIHTVLQEWNTYYSVGFDGLYRVVFKEDCEVIK
jgi:hypothetical protein